MALLVILPVLREGVGGPALALVDSFYRTGSLVFGGGHVVLPLLEAEGVPTRWVTPDAFLAGYGVMQAVPGPLFTFSAYLGAVSAVGLPALLAAGLALGTIFLPSFLLVAGALPFWNALSWVRSRCCGAWTRAWWRCSCREGPTGWSVTRVSTGARRATSTKAHEAGA